jgi:hypothetical protein
MLTGSLKVTLCRNIFSVEVYHNVPNVDGPPGSTTPSLFAKAPMDLFSNPTKSVQHYIEAVVDSSRYFVLRFVDDKSTKSIHLGVGFRERDDALAFVEAANTYARDIKREREIEENAKNGVVPVFEDLSLKEGAKIAINIGGSIGGREIKKKERKAGGGGLRPPPAAGVGLRPPPTAGLPIAIKAPPAAENITQTPVSTPSFGTMPTASVNGNDLMAALGGDAGGADDDDEDFGDFEGA